MISCPEGITPNSGLTGPNNTIYIYIYPLNTETCPGYDTKLSDGEAPVMLEL